MCPKLGTENGNAIAGACSHQREGRVSDMNEKITEEQNDISKTSRIRM
jgi:hypothetical protein